MISAVKLLVGYSSSGAAADGHTTALTLHTFIYNSGCDDMAV
jgi:hypothetical protein